MEAAKHRELASGTMLDDKYRIDSLIAIGGMGAVYQGTHLGLRKRVAIKVINPELSNDVMIERFHREAVTASQIGHEGIAQVTDIGTSRAGEPFLVMELLEGESLASRLKRTGPLPVHIACELACSILAPLAAAHAAGIVHRDLKPDNVFLVRQSRGEMVKLLDFGISRSQGAEGEFRLTTTGLVLGTPYYMSPEQARGDTGITHVADIYALGTMLYEMLVGSVPITADNYNQLMYRVMTGEFVPPRQRRPEIPERLEHIILSAMALEPSHRLQNAEQLERALLEFCRPAFRDHTIERISNRLIDPQTSDFERLSSRDVATDRTVAATPMGMSAARPLASELEPRPMRPPTRSRRGVWIAVVLVLAVAGGVAGAVAMSGGEAVETATKPAPEATPPATAPTPAPTPAPAPAPAPETTAAPAATEERSSAPAVAEPAPAAVVDEPAPTAVDEPTTVGATKSTEATTSTEATKSTKATTKTPKTTKTTKTTKSSQTTKSGRRSRIDDKSPYEQ